MVPPSLFLGGCGVAPYWLQLHLFRFPIQLSCFSPEFPALCCFYPASSQFSPSLIFALFSFCVFGSFLGLRQVLLSLVLRGPLTLWAFLLCSELLSFGFHTFGVRNVAFGFQGSQIVEQELSDERGVFSQKKSPGSLIHLTVSSWRQRREVARNRNTRFVLRVLNFLLERLWKLVET